MRANKKEVIKMPGRNGAGPLGKGPKTGRGLGRRLRKGVGRMSGKCVKGIKRRRGKQA